MHMSCLRSTAALLGAAILATVPAAAAELPGKVLQTATINGFTVNLRAFPTKATLHRPTSTYGDVTIGTQAQGVSPYRGSPLDGSPFISMGLGGVSYTLKAPAASIAFIWGTPDFHNILEMFDTSGNYIGVITGGDINKAFASVQPSDSGAFLQVVSPTPLGSVVGFSEECCFEIGNEAAMYNTAK